MKTPRTMNRRAGLKTLAGALAASPLTALADDHKPKPLELKYVLSSALYGDLPIAEVLPEVANSGSVGLDIWCKKHATHREQVDEIGFDKFEEMLAAEQVDLKVTTRYPFGPFGMEPEFAFAKQMGVEILLCATKGPKNPTGAEAKSGVKEFIEKMKPHAEAAMENGQIIAVENHGNALLHTPDSVKYFAEFNNLPGLKVAYAPHHMQSFGDEKVAEMIKVLGADQIPFIYFQEHGIGSKETVAKEIELEQLPGRGTLDYVPILAALREIGFNGYAEIFMHPTPRGIPMLPTAPEITKVVNESRRYLDQCLKEVNA